ncbi:MAG: hypothetical protein AB7O50_16355 [Pseudolabrys sp.]
MQIILVKTADYLSKIALNTVCLKFYTLSCGGANSHADPRVFTLAFTAIAARKNAAGQMRGG